MKQTAIKIFLACAIGGFIGTLVAMQLGIFWWAGVLVGGFTGYLSYEFKRVLTVAKMITGEAIDEIICLFTTREGKKRIKSTIPYLFVIGTMLFNCAAVSFLFNHPDFVPSHDGMSKSTADFFGMAFFLFILAIMPAFIYSQEAEEAGRALTKSEKKIACVIMMFVPGGLSTCTVALVLVAALNYLFWAVPRWIVTVLRGLPRSVAIVAKAIKKLFILIHSEIRLLCGVDAMLGALIGYFYWSPILGALAGGLLGVANYYLISVKLLKLLPVLTKK
jgi:hypothetical protein